tara:strand:+ start:2220 stop:3398 length:1179 start_codon:yes stop_codon:yes gene_type:complete
MTFLRACLLTLSFLLVVPSALGQERTKQETWAKLTIAQTDDVGEEILFLRSYHPGTTGLWSYSVGQVPERRCDVGFEEAVFAWHVKTEDSSHLLVVHDQGAVSMLDPATGRTVWTDKCNWIGPYGYPDGYQFVATPDDPKALGILTWPDLKRGANGKEVATGMLHAASVHVDGLQPKWERPLTFDRHVPECLTHLTWTGTDKSELLCVVVEDNRLTRLCPFCGAQQWTVEITDPALFLAVGLSCVEDSEGNSVILLGTGHSADDWILMIDGETGATLKRVADPHSPECPGDTHGGDKLHPAHNGRVFIQLLDGNYGFLDAFGRLQIPSKPPTLLQWRGAPMSSVQILHGGSQLLVVAVSPWGNEIGCPQLVVLDPETTDVVHQAWNRDFALR